MVTFLQKTIMAFSLLVALSSEAQINNNWQWTWMKGDSTINNSGSYGTKGSASNDNKPGARFNSVGWKDLLNNLWLFGGFGLAGSTTDYLNDLWRFNPTLNQWTWINGDSTASVYGIYGIAGISAATNKPGGRYYSNTWTDMDGNLWLFGGLGYATNGTPGNLNDLWKYDPAANEWAWMKGDNIRESPGFYGIRGTAASTNKPGARDGGVSWSDKAGNLWLFGGIGAQQNGTDDYFNDLWKYDVSANEWIWINGDKTSGNSGNYGIQGTASVNNKPGARAASISWMDKDGNLWLFGGSGFAESGNLNELNDLWKYDPAINEWTWISGNKTGRMFGIYGAQGIPAVNNKPGARVAASGFKDSLDNLLLFGGIGYGSNNIGSLNDLWQYNIANNQWTWIKGDNTVGSNGVYGAYGIPADSNKPGSRFGNTTWSDSTGALYVFGGTGYASSGFPEYLNDLWKLSPGNSSLPLTLLNFSASRIQKDVLVTWQTAEQQNTAYFIIEYSKEGINFSKLGLVTADNNNSSTNNYSFTDQKVSGTYNFYRLKIVDTDGKTSYSKIVRVTKYEQSNLKIFPNPVKETLYVEASGNNEEATARIFDLSGRKIKEEIVLLNGFVTFSLNVKDIPAGTYTLVLIKILKTEQQKFVKQ